MPPRQDQPLLGGEEQDAIYEDSQLNEVDYDGEVELGTSVDREEEDLPEKDTIMSPVVEHMMKKKHPRLMTWLKSSSGSLAQYAIVLIVIWLGIYENVFKRKATPLAKAAAKHNKHNPSNWENGSFDMNILLFWVSVLSVIIGVVLSIMKKTTDQLFTREAFKMFLVFFPAGVAFGFSQFLGLFISQKLGPDVQKVLDQIRMIMTATASVIFLGKSYSRAVWNVYILVSFASVMYVMMKMEIHNTSALMIENEKLKQNVKLEKDDDDSNEIHVFMCLLCLLNASVMAIAGVYAEKCLKKYKSTPFYIQKIFIETPNILFQILIACATHFIFKSESWLRWFGNNEHEIKEALKDPDQTFFNQKSFFEGYLVRVNFWWWPLFISFFLKSYMQGILVKRLSSVVKQMAQLVIVGCMLFVMPIHECAISYRTKTPLGEKTEYGQFDKYKHFFCFGDIVPGDYRTGLQYQMVIADLVVILSVVAFIMSARDKERKIMYKLERDARPSV